MPEQCLDHGGAAGLAETSSRSRGRSRSMPGRPMSVRDAGWLPYYQLRVIGPLAGVTPSAVRESLAALHRRDPNHPALCRLDRLRRRWIPLGAADFSAAVAENVAELPGDLETRPADTGEAEPGPAVALRRLLIGQELGEWPLHVLLHRGFIGIRMSHAAGDGQTLNALVPQLLGAATSAPVTRPCAAPACHWPAPVCATSARDPRRLRGLLTVPRPVLPGTGAGRATSRLAARSVLLPRTLQGGSADPVTGLA